MNTGDISELETIDSDILEAKKHPELQAFVQYTRKAEGLAEDEWEFGGDGGDHLEDMVSWITYLHKQKGAIIENEPQPASSAISSQQEREPAVPVVPVVPAEDAVSASAVGSDPIPATTINPDVTCDQKSASEGEGTSVPVVAIEQRQERAATSANHQEHSETETETAAATAAAAAPDAPEPKPVGSEKAPITVFTDPGKLPQMPVVNSDVILTYLDPETNKLSGNARQSAFDKCYGNTRIVARPSASVAAEKLAVQADIRSSFLKGVSAGDHADASASSGKAADALALATPSTPNAAVSVTTSDPSNVERAGGDDDGSNSKDEGSLEALLEEMMDASMEKGELFASPSPSPRRPNAAKAKAAPKPEPKVARGRGFGHANATRARGRGRGNGRGDAGKHLEDDEFFLVKVVGDRHLYSMFAIWGVDPSGLDPMPILFKSQKIIKQ